MGKSSSRNIFAFHYNLPVNSIRSAMMDKILTCRLYAFYKFRGGRWLILESIGARDTRTHLDVRVSKVAPHIYILIPKDPNSELMVTVCTPHTCMERIKELVSSVAHPVQVNAHDINEVPHEESPSTTQSYSLQPLALTLHSVRHTHTRARYSSSCSHSHPVRHTHTQFIHAHTQFFTHTQFFVLTLSSSYSHSEKLFNWVCQCQCHAD